MMTHPGPPPLLDEHAYFEALLPAAQATHMAVQSGNWSRAATWWHGVLPVAHAKVYIPTDVFVVYDIGQSPDLAWLRIEGGLSFATKGSQSLLVETITVLMTGRLDIGKPSSPATNQITITFADNGPLDTNHDPLQMGRGLISHGRVGIYGKPVVSFLTLAVNPIAGSNRIQVAGAAQWAVGSTLLITGTLGIGEDEEVIIRSRTTARGVTTYTVDRPLTYDHTTPAGLYAYVALENRNVTFTSENTTDSSRFGHVMLMHGMDNAVKYAAFTHLGRTNKDRSIDDLTDPGGGTNVRGRYGLHFHRNGNNPAQQPIQVIGNYLSNSPGWGYVNHSANVAFRDNVSYNVTGAGFATETGSEIGSFVHNLAVYERGGLFRGKRVHFDYGYEGIGFHFQGVNVDVVGNIAASAFDAGYSITASGFDEPGIGQAMLPTASLKDPSIANGAAMIRATDAPMRSFVGNEAFASGTAWASYVLRPMVTELGRNEVVDLVGWNNGLGINGAYSYDLTFDGIRLLDTSRTKTGIEATGDSKNWTMRDAYVTGWGYGYRLPSEGANPVSGGTWDNVVNFLE